MVISLVRGFCWGLIILIINSILKFNLEHYSSATSLKEFLCLCLKVISLLRVLSRSVATGSKFDRELWSNGLSPVLNLWKKLNQVSLFVICNSFYTNKNHFFHHAFHMKQLNLKQC